MVKVRYTKEEFEKIKKKARKLKKSPHDYQKEISKKSKVIVKYA